MKPTDDFYQFSENKMSTTPRTDAARGFYDMDTAVSAEDMEQLETELAAAKKRIADCEFVMDHRYKIIERQEQRCNEANARAEKAEADTARLDWLSVSDVWLDVPATEAFTPETIRAAIDLAMKEASK